MARRSRSRNWAEYLLVQLLRMIFLSFPINLNLRTAKVLGWLWAKLSPEKSYLRAVANLDMAMGSRLSQHQIRRVALASMQNFVMTGIELMQSPRLINRWTWRKYVTLRDVDGALRIMTEGKPAIMVTGHFGNFELLGQLLACLNGKFWGVARGMDNPLINDFLVRTRSHTGLRLIFKKGAMFEAQQLLRDRRMLGFLGDQDAGRKGIFVDFFGRKASTFKSVALLAVEHDVPVIVGYCRRLQDRFRFELGVERVIEPHEWQGREDAITWVTQQYTSAIEAIVLRCPEQYLWTHRRWKTRPKEEA
jgi:KDO2-lipid IV(A) lauroyltransferase